MRDGGLAAFAADSGEQLWRRNFEGPTSGRLRPITEPAIAETNVVVVGSSDGSLRGVSTASGESRWTVTPPEEVGYWTAPALDGTTAYVAANGRRDVNGTTRADAGRGWLYAVDTEDGTIEWSVADPGAADPPVVCAGGVVVSMGLDVVRYE